MLLILDPVLLFPFSHSALSTPLLAILVSIGCNRCTVCSDIFSSFADI